MPKPKATLLIEPVAEVREGLLRRYAGQYERIAHAQAPLLLRRQSRGRDNSNDDQDGEGALEEEIAKLIRTFEREPVQKLVSGGGGGQEKGDKRNCTVCRSPEAKSRCSR